MKRWMNLLFFSLLILSGCSSEKTEEVKNTDQKEATKQEMEVKEESQEESQKETVNQNTEEKADEQKNEEVVSSPKETPEKDDKKGKSDTADDGPYLKYRPEAGLKKEFKEGDVVLLTEQVIAADSEYVQIALTLGDSVTTQIFKWTGTEITLVFEDRDLQDHFTSILPSFQPNQNERLAGEGSVWEMINESGEADTPYGKQKNVLVIQKTSEEAAGEKTIFTRYYAPGLGMVKEDFELTGENGYKGESSLSSVE
ncbi:hypothetical protein [Metabacillus indicus]|uniref:hypothetical protein n=1 Tax=Metabacillus indicus TaxID=246786 RepID=UPI0004937C89|nr:hypothetical protein [Metabacillus indicus]KEZ48778.1 hypothetical protein AZ46_0217975 [Metabacillus indicus LMG 22858]